MPRIDSKTWVGWLAGTFAIAAGGVFSVVVWAFGEFETKENSKEKAAVAITQVQELKGQLRRIECKIDVLNAPPLSRGNNSNCY